MRELVIISGKGGTGKTSIAAAITTLLQNDCVVADCDVDAADMHLLLKPDFALREDFYSGVEARIDEMLCRNCGICADVCRFDAIVIKKGHYTVDPFSCEGCGYCAKICRPRAIMMDSKIAGEWYISRTKYGSPMVHAKLGIGAENSGKLVAKVKNEAKKIGLAEDKKWMIVDGSPGIGCPVVSSLSGADFVLLVTEPSLSGLHDLKRVYAVVKKFGIKAGCMVNKADINNDITEQIIQFAKDEDILHVGNIPYNISFTQAMVEEKTIIEYGDVDLCEIVKEGFKKIENKVQKKDKK